jgi:NADPH:quinone reductase-like Zn-dependent oxidoreductase
LKRQSTLKAKDNLVTFGGSGNTGLFCTQFGKIIDAITISLSTKPWIKEYGADYVLPIDENLREKIYEITNGAMADVVINSLGEKTWAKGMEIVGKLGKIITFGVLTGGNLFTDGRLLYNKQITIKGTSVSLILWRILRRFGKLELSSGVIGFRAPRLVAR